MKQRHTPDGRYLVVRGRLWRAANPHLPADRRDALVQALMQARRDVKAALRIDDEAALRRARDAVQAASWNWASADRCGGRTVPRTTTAIW